MWLLIAFIAVPVIEIFLFIQVGGAIGTPLTLLIVIVTAILGTYFVRSQGLATLARLQGSFHEMRDPTEPLVHGAMILFAGALLLTPGFFTDAVGFSLMVPQFRTFMFEALRKRVKVSSFSTFQTTNPGSHYNRGDVVDGDVIDGDFEEVKDTSDAPKGPSGWTKH